MIKKLNGWQRLWVVVSGLYLCFVGVYVTLTLPTPANIPHSQAFYDQLRPELKKNIIVTSPLAEYELIPIKPIDPHEKKTQKKLQEEWVDAEPLDHVTLPNGHVLYFLSSLPERDKTEVKQDYWRIIEKEAREKQLQYIFMALYFWAGPVIILYVLGWSVGWIYRGFREKQVL